MFYSHTFLARKGPLGTVWCAAHLQNRLKKSHYLATDVISTVERIMYPEVPIALRMSGHLLLGVVRIYSKQVEYFYEDCNAIQHAMNRDLPSASVNLPENATKAALDSVTLPENFQLDSLDIDDNPKDRPENSHVKSWEDITLTDQMPTGTDPYIVIDVNEQGEDLGAGPVPMEEDVPTNGVVNGSSDVREFSPGGQFGFDALNIGNISPQEVPTIEVMRAAGNDVDFNMSPILPDRADPDDFLVEELNRDSRGITPVAEEKILSPVRDFFSPRINEELPSSAHLDSLAQKSPEELVIQRTPVFQVPAVRKKKRKHHFDDHIILSNKCMRDMLDDTTDLIREKGDIPSTSLGIWKLNKKLRVRKDGIFVEPYLDGASADLQGLYMLDDVLPSRFHVVSPETQHQEMNIAQHDNNDLDIEVLRNEFPSPGRDIPSFSVAVPSPNVQGYFSGENTNIELQSAQNTELEMGTPEISGCGQGFPGEQTVLPEVPEMVSSPGELGFLNHLYNNSPAGSEGTPPGNSIFSNNQATPQLHLLSSRTRAVGEYLRRQSSASPVGEGSSGDLCLDRILEGKPRKICARMFYETLVLKSYGLVEVQQEKPYDDIILKVNPELKEQL